MGARPGPGLPRWCWGKGPSSRGRRPKRCGLIAGSGRSPAVGNGNLPQYSCLENSLHPRAYGAAKSWTRLSDWTQNPARTYCTAKQQQLQKRTTSKDLPHSTGSSAQCYVTTQTEKAVAPRSSTLAWKIPRTEEPGGLQSMGSLRVEHDWATSLSLFTFMHWRRKWRPTPVFLPGESQGRGSLVGCRLWGRTERTRLKWLSSRSSKWEEMFRKTYIWITTTLLYTWHYHYIVNQLHSCRNVFKNLSIEEK